MNSLTLTNGSSAPQGVRISMGSGVTLVVSTDGDGKTYTAVAKHASGNVTYAVESDSAAIYRNDTLHGPGGAVQAGYEKLTAPDSDQFSGLSGWLPL